MFTGIIEALGTVREVSSSRLVVVPNSRLENLELGESIAVNGCCLTVTTLAGPLTFDLSEETMLRTTLSDLGAGDLVNLERAMRANGRFGGHIVQGHVDATGSVVAILPNENATEYIFRIPETYARYLIDKGSIAVDGISLTVVGPKDDFFSAWIIPHTLEHTNLGQKMIGDRVNLEFDQIAKYVERLIGARQ